MKPNAALAQEYLDELISKEREIEKETDKAKREAKRSKDRVKSLKQRTAELLDLLEGRTNAQPPLPMTTKSGKPEVPPLKWERKDTDLVAETSLGLYHIAAAASGPGFLVTFTPKSGRQVKLDPSPTEAAGKAVAQRDWLERAGSDSILENAGSGALMSEERRKAAAKDRKSKGKPGDDAIDVTPRKALPPKKGEA